MMRKRTEPELSTYLHLRGKKLGLPINGTFELTARCNFNCPMCYVHQNSVRPEEELSAGQWLELARQAKDRGMIFVLLTGGEPFLRKDFFEIYEGIKAMGMMVSINTNGSLLEGEIRQRLIQNPPFRVNVSLYGGCAETYRSMCGQDAFQRVVDNIRALREAGIDVRLNLSVTPYNRNDQTQIFQIAKELDIHIKATSYMYPPIRINGQQYGCGDRLSAEESAECTVEWDLLRFTEEEFELRAQTLEKLQAIEEKECSADLDEGVSCRAGRSSFWITWDGRMVPCGMLPCLVEYPLETGFNEAWEHILVGTRQIRMPKECVSCSKRQVCSVCPAVCFTETGGFEKKPEYVCRQMDEIIRLTRERYLERSKKNDHQEGTD